MMWPHQDQERFRQLIESAPISLVILDREAKIAFVNHAAEAMFGRQRDELVGQHYRILVPGRFHEDHRRFQAEYLAAPRSRTLGSGDELLAVRKDGSEFPVEVGLTPLATESGFLVLAAIVDVSERKRAELSLRESELRTRSTLQSALDGVVMMDEQGLVTFWNSQAEVMFGYAASEAVGQPLKDLIIPPLYRSAHVEGLRQFLTKGVSTILNQRLELAALRRNGEEFPIELTVIPVRIRDRYEFSAFVRDVTQRKRSEAHLQELNRTLERRVEERTRLAALLRDVAATCNQAESVDEACSAVVAESVEAEQRRIGQELHDGIGQELTALSLLSRSIALTLKSEGSSAADKADEFASGIPRLVRQIRNVIRGLMPVELDANGLMSALQQLADSTQQRYGIRCQLDARRAVPVPNPTVAHHLFRIAQEAINNALKHGRPKSIILTLQANNSTLVLSVRDDGSGIEADTSDSSMFRLIRRRVRDDDSGIEVDTARSTDRRPRGMGLHIMRHRARLIGGQLTIQCESGGGTVVKCTLKGQKTSDDEH